MDALVQSFVNKVHRHTVARVAPDNEGPLPACEDPTSFLLPLISFEAPDDTLHATLESILATYRRTKVTFRKHGGLMKILPLIGRPSLSPGTASVLIEFLHGEASVPCMFAAAVLHAQDSLQCVQRLLALLVSSGPDALESLLVIVNAMLEDVDTCEILHKMHPSPIAQLLPMMTTRVYENSHLCERALKCMSELVHDHETANMFWRAGHFLVEAVAVKVVSKQSSSDRTPLILAISHLNLVAPRSTESCLASYTNLKMLCKALAIEMQNVTAFRLFDLIMRSATLRHNLPRQVEHFRGVLVRYLGTFMHDLIEDNLGYIDVLHTLQNVIELATPLKIEDRGSETLRLYHAVCACTASQDASQMLRLKALAAHVTCLLGTPNLIGFVKLLGALQVLRSDCPESDALDEVLWNLFLQGFSKDPCRMVEPFTIHGKPPRLLLHLARDLLGDSIGAPRRKSNKRHTRTERVIMNTLQGQVEEAIQEGGVSALHAREVAAHFGIEYEPQEEEMDSEITCPITLVHMHCPVILSDGHTYELAAIVRCTSTTFPWISPVTREELEPWMVYNRACLASNRIKAPKECKECKPKSKQELKPEPPASTMRRTLNGRRSSTTRSRANHID